MMSKRARFQDAPAPTGIALFDLDGTLVPWDCQIVFRHQIIRNEPLRGLSLAVFLMFAPLFPILGDQGMKRVFLSYLWRMPADVLDQYAEAFASEVAAHAYPELLSALHAHQKAGHLTVLTSASPSCYVKKIGDQLGFDVALGTDVDHGPLFPDLKNHKGQAKVARLQSLFPASWWLPDGRLRNSHGFTDSGADLPLLGICQHATLVNPNPELACLGQQQGWDIMRPPRPWHSPLHRLARMAAMILGMPVDPWHA